ncbi:hypothetical protein SAMN02799630_03074 [Paenibacillus sp. UNCCL117]|uniref:hypothetical protein n=1 Tax=unclassified Paenibacillus TaxID=185978 RepID=UPI00088302D7|nr:MULTISPECIES: hypothetical protein [unclassified Paenibacillus]SDD92721.1 hypothetical protein SAMN04488602_115112 [Paenibacillus sp. cl123]SFW43393.1 hypothetical protein SAMN02799630_03074 [Paenibacillus sp. UNCCL117]
MKSVTVNEKTYYSFSGIYPHLAWTNGTVEKQEKECGLGALVPWNGKLWFITYPTHSPYGSNDKLNILSDDMTVYAHPLSVGGTHANRMIHKESNQLIIGPYFVGADDEVRVVPPDRMEGRLTGVARHLTAPANKVYFYTMESGIYEVDVHTLEVTTLYRDPNHVTDRERPYLLPGTHGKGAYTGQGRLVVSNNGLGGVLAEWNGEGDAGRRASWTIVDANKYTEVTGPGGLYGAPDEAAPLWALGWDAKSVLLNVCDGGIWRRYRLPMGSYTHSADDGWFTEWPRIRDIGMENWLMDMFGMLYEFPSSFSHANTAGIRPISVHHKMIVDFDHWNGQLVLGCNDASTQGNPMTGRCQSNLVFTSFDKLAEFGQPAGWGSLWANENISAGENSEPFQFAGYERRIFHLSHQEAEPVQFGIELDVTGNGTWTTYAEIEVAAGGYNYHIFPADLQAEWLRVTPARDAKGVSAALHFNAAQSNQRLEAVNAGLADAGRLEGRSEAILYATNDLSLPLHLAVNKLDASGQITGSSFYELNADMALRTIEQPDLERTLRGTYAPETAFEVDEASVVVTDQDGRRYRLPKGHSDFDLPSASGPRRGIREIITERSLMNLHGSFYELPDERSGGLRKIQPICTHNKLIYDFCSWRGLLALSGVRSDGVPDEHTIYDEKGEIGLWLGSVDELRKFGAPAGTGGPWKGSAVRAGQPSDPYLMLGYMNKSLKLSHEGADTIHVLVEVDVQGDDNWVTYAKFAVPAGQEHRHTFPDGYSAHWVRLTSDQDTIGTALFAYS